MQLFLFNNWNGTQIGASMWHKKQQTGTFHSNLLFFLPICLLQIRLSNKSSLALIELPILYIKYVNVNPTRFAASLPLPQQFFFFRSFIHAFSSIRFSAFLFFNACFRLQFFVYSSFVHFPLPLLLLSVRLFCVCPWNDWYKCWPWPKYVFRPPLSSPPFFLLSSPMLFTRPSLLITRFYKKEQKTFKNFIFLISFSF